jgi:hypothetical protein
MSQVLGVLFAVLIGMMVLPNFGRYQQMSSDNSRAVATAQQQQQLYAAASAYIQQNATAVQAACNATTPAIITVAMLQGVNLLPAAFNAVNPYGQTWQVEVLQPSAGILQSLVLATGGTSLPDVQASRIATLMGAAGGFIPLNDSGTYAGGAASARGSYAGWTIATTNYTGASGGHPAALLSFNNGQLVSNYLYRNAVPGQPQLNQMGTAIDMNGNNINNAATVNAVDVNASGYVQAPSGNNLRVGSTRYYGDNTNSAVRQDGDFYVQHHDGSAANVNAATFSDSNNLAFYIDPAGPSFVNTIVARGDANNAIYASSNNWSAVFNDAGGNNNSAPQSIVGSAFVNDIYFRSTNRWASQISSSTFKGMFTIAFNGSCQAGNPLSGGCSCPAGSWPAIAGTFYMNGFWSSQPDTLYACY